MKTTKLRGRRTLLGLLPTLVLALCSVQSSGQSQPAYSIDFHTLSAGGQTLANACLRLSGTLAEIAPGYSSGGIYAVYAGFWSAAPARGVDEVFFSGFEGC